MEMFCPFEFVGHPRPTHERCACMPESHTPNQPERPDYTAIIEDIRQKILNRLIHAHETFDSPIRALSGKELRVALQLHNDLTTVLERVIELQGLESVIDRMLSRDPNDSDAKQLQDEKTLLTGMISISESSFMPFLKLTAHERGLDPSPYVRCYENPTLATRADAVALTERLKLMSYSDREPSGTEKRSLSSPSAVVVDAIDAEDLSILEFLNRPAGLRRKVSEVLPAVGPQDRKAIAARLRRLADREPALVDYPKAAEGKRNGVAILPAGIEALKRATPPTSH